jgi:hypothetical protein
MTTVKLTPSIITRNPSINLACFVATGFLSLAANTAYAVSCTANTTLSSLFQSTSQNVCTVTPDYVKIGVYQFGICTSMPTNTDVQMCDFFLSSNNATTLTLGINSSGTLDGASQAAIGQKVYTHAIMVIDNKIFLKDSFQFDTARKSSDGQEGAICWTNGQPNGFLSDSPTDNGVTCGSTDEAVETEASYKYFGVSGNYSASVTNSLGTTNNYTLVQGLAPSPVATDDDNGSHIFMAQEMKTSVDMTGNPDLDISFKVTDAAQLSFYDGSQNGVNFCTDTLQPCVGNIEVNTIDLRVTIN